jgi:hypothetical protein
VGNLTADQFYEKRWAMAVLDLGNGTVQLYHVAYTFDATGVFNGRILETQTNTVSADGSTYSGNFDRKFYDLNGNFLLELRGTLTATRIRDSRLLLPDSEKSGATEETLTTGGRPSKAADTAVATLVADSVFQFPDLERSQEKALGAG